MKPLPQPPRIVLATLNARYIHASLGLRCLLANLDRHGAPGLRAQAVLREYTVARPLQEVLADLLATLPTVDPSQPRPILGLGVYIWNVAASTELVRRLRGARPDVCVVLGGPEVSHEWAQQPIVALADHVVTGWGEVGFAQLCRALLLGPRPLQKIIAGVQPPLHEIHLPDAEFSDADLRQRVLYVEASRGCPFTCAFCLSALDKTAWAFPLPAVLESLQRLWARGARSFKFVDRTFNLRLEHSTAILDFFLQRIHPEAGAAPHLHFEVVPDRLPAALRERLARFPPGVLQLEVGIQTWDPAVQQRIARRQDNAATEANLRWLRTHTQAHLHTDLILGLPGETLEGFAAGFDRLWALQPQEIQLGLLKRLRGAPINRLSAAHAMVYDTEPPYTVRQTDALDAPTLARGARIARHWDVLANSGRYPRTLARVLGTPQGAFARLARLSDHLWHHLGRTQHVTPEEWVDALHAVLCGPLGQELGLDPQDVRADLLEDYRASGARAQPRCLRGLLPHTPPQSRRTSALRARQDQHRAGTATFGSPSKPVPHPAKDG